MSSREINADSLLDADITPVIALNPRSGEHPNPTGTAQHVNEHGVPLCDAGLPMRRCSHDKKKHRIYYNCPVKRPTHRKGEHLWISHEEECPLGVLCHPDTKMSPVVYVKTTQDPRLYPPIARKSERFRTLSNLRSGCERSNAQKKQVYRLGRRVCRNASHYLLRLYLLRLYLLRLYLVSLIEHAKAWLAQDRKQCGEDPFLLMSTHTTTHPNSTQGRLEQAA